MGAGDEIVKVADGPERMTITEINALLYLPGHPCEQLERALRIPALRTGWRSSLQALLQQELSGGTVTGNAGLAPASGSPSPRAGVPPPAGVPNGSRVQERNLICARSD